MATVQTKQDLIGRLRRHRDDLCRLGVRRIGLFGSFQRDDPDPDSDVDLLVEFAPGEKSFDHFMAVAFLLEDELGRPVDVVTREALPPIWFLTSWTRSNTPRSETAYLRHTQDEAR